MVTNARPKTPNDIDAVIVLARKGDSIVELIHGRLGLDLAGADETAKKALPKVLAAL